MKKNFWKKLEKPFFALAPMADVTDLAFRRMIIKYGKPDVMYTEFVSADGLCNEKGREVLVKDLRFLEEERPVIAQIFGSKPENIEKAAKLVEELGFDGVDINMGCPEKVIVKQGSGAALIRTPELAKEIIRAAKKGVKNIPVSVKTRIGFNDIITEEWVSQIAKEKPDAIIVHGRTRKEMSEVSAHWDEIGKASDICKKTGIVFVGNGDIQSIEDGKGKASKYGVDGVMVGRGIFGNPWFFNEDIDVSEVSLKEKLDVMLEHTKNFEVDMRGIKSFSVMKKHYKAYVGGFSGAKELRSALMESDDYAQAEEIVKKYIKKDKK